MRILDVRAACMVAAASLLSGMAERLHAAPPARTLSEIIRQTAAVVEADVSDVSYTYTDAEGPRTVFRLTNVRTLFGAPQGGVLELKTFGGPLPDGKFLMSPDVAQLRKGARHVLFLRNVPGELSPIVNDALALRLEKVRGRTVMVNSEGHVLARLTAEGCQFSGTRVTHESPFRAEVAPRLRADLPADLATNAASRDDLVASLREFTAARGMRFAGRAVLAPAPSDLWTPPSAAQAKNAVGPDTTGPRR
jgi:hypothetical protein